jgi:hypothetical protein
MNGIVEFRESKLENRINKLTMDIEKIKAQILSITTNGTAYPTMDDDTYAELYESDVQSLIIECESKDTSGRISFEKRILGETDQNYDEDYFCYERNLKYLVFSGNQEDVLD